MGSIVCNVLPWGDEGGTTGHTSIQRRGNAGMSWEYRVMNVDGQHAIHEVHYEGNDRAKPKTYSMNPTFPRGEDLADLQEDIQRYFEALTLPVLTPGDFARSE